MTKEEVIKRFNQLLIAAEDADTCLQYLSRQSCCTAPEIKVPQVEIAAVQRTLSNALDDIEECPTIEEIVDGFMKSWTRAIDTEYPCPICGEMDKCSETCLIERFFQ